MRFRKGRVEDSPMDDADDVEIVVGNDENMQTSSILRNVISTLFSCLWASVTAVAVLFFTVFIETASLTSTHTTVPAVRMKKLEKWKEPKLYTYKDVKRLIKLVSMGEIKDPSGLEKALKTFPKKDAEVFRSKTMRFIVKLAREFKQVFPDGIPRLQQGESCSLTFERRQIVVALAASFVGLLPSRPDSNYPYMSYAKMLAFKGDGLYSAKAAQAIQFVLHYFNRMGKDYAETNDNFESRSVTITRYALPQNEPFKSGTTLMHGESPLTEFTLLEERRGVEETPNSFHSDFANKFMGGGVEAITAYGTQDEVLFLISPECVMSMLTCEVMADHESITISGAERFSNYSGYRRSLQWTGNFIEGTDSKIQLDLNGNWKKLVVAYDAINFKSKEFKGESQTDPKYMRRELVKAYAAVKNAKQYEANWRLASGLWGCGCFGGNVQLKALLVHLAVSLAKVDEIYHSFGNPTALKVLRPMDKCLRDLRDLNVTVQDVWNALLKYKGSFSGDKLP
eukprot:611874_1